MAQFWGLGSMLDVEKMWRSKWGLDTTDTTQKVGHVAQKGHLWDLWDLWDLVSSPALSAFWQCLKFNSPIFDRWSIRWTNALRTIDLNRGWYYSIMNHPVLIRTVSVKKIDTTFSITFSTLFDFTWFYSYIFWTLLSKPSEIVGSSQLLRSLIGSRSSTTANV